MSPDEKQLNTKSPTSLKISAKKTKRIQKRICLGDIFTNIEISENINVEGSTIVLERLFFPYVVCLNQECDLERDFTASRTDNKDHILLHLAIAPAFSFEDFLLGEHWGKIFSPGRGYKRKDSKIQLIQDNEIPRFHYLKFPTNDPPELIIDFKHFFTVNRNFLYSKLDNRLCSVEDLFKEKISQRFSFFLSRIGLPEEPI